MEPDIPPVGDLTENLSTAFNLPYTLQEWIKFNKTLVVNLFNNKTYDLCKNEMYRELPVCNFSAEINSAEPAKVEFPYAFIVELVVPIIFGIVVLVGVFGNSLVVIVIIINKQMRSTTNYLIFSLAIADLLFTVFCVPFTASDYIFDKWPFGILWCKVVQYLTYVTAYASVYTLLLLSFDRYLAVVHPIYAMTIRTERNAIYAILGTWTLILTSCLPLSFVHGVGESNTCMFIEEKYHRTAFHIGFITTMYFIPLTVIVGLYLMILQRLWSQPGPGGTRSAESVRGKKRVTRMVVIVVVTFIICWLPIQVVFLLKSLNMYQMNTFQVFVQIFGQVLAYTNSCINPILYAFLSDPFRKAFHKVISCGPNSKSLNRRVGSERTLKSPTLTTARRQSQSFGQLQETMSMNTCGMEDGLTRGRSKRDQASSTTTTTSFINDSNRESDNVSEVSQLNPNGNITDI